MKIKLSEISLFGVSGLGEIGGGGVTTGPPQTKGSKQKTNQQAISTHDEINRQK